MFFVGLIIGAILSIALMPSEVSVNRPTSSPFGLRDHRDRRFFPEGKTRASSDFQTAIIFFLSVIAASAMVAGVSG